MSTTVVETGADCLAVHVGFHTTLTDAIMRRCSPPRRPWSLEHADTVPRIYWLTVVLVSVVGRITDGLEASLYAGNDAFFEARKCLDIETQSYSY
jgi:uncharacterized membrane-anchored protein